MKKTFKILAVVLCAALLMGIGGMVTLALLQDSDETVNVMTLGNVYIEQIEQERDANGELVDFTQAKPLYPAWYEGTSIPYADPADWPVANDEAWKVVADNENVIDKFVTVKNTGKSAAYVRTIIAYEGEAINGPDIHVVHNANTSSDADVAEQFEDVQYIENVVIDDVRYDVIVYTYANPLAAGETTIPSLKQVYLDVKSGNEVSESFGESYVIMTLSQAVQTNGFANATEALDAGFGEITAANVAGLFGEQEIPYVVYTAEDLKNLLTSAGSAGAGDSTVELSCNIDMTGQDWTPINVDGYHGADVVTLNGNGYTIKGLNAPLFHGGFAGGSGIIIKDLTIAESNIVSTNSTGSGAFIEYIDSMDVITLSNCHLIDSTVSGSRTGGLLGYTSGYNNENDGAVKTYVTVEDCSVVNCTITGSSVGGIIGHAGANPWTYSTFKNNTVTGCSLNSTDTGAWRVGVVVGTANVGEVTITGTTESGNTLTQTGKTAPAGQSNLYGRFVPGTTGKLVIDGTEITLN